jgi:hypothetical protein
MRRALRHLRMDELRPDGNQVHHLAGCAPQTAVYASVLLHPLCVLPVIPDGGGEP